MRHPCPHQPPHQAAPARPRRYRPARRTVSRFARPRNSAANRFGGSLIEPLRRTVRHQLAVAHDRDPVGKRQGLDLVVRDVQHRQVRQVAVQPRQFVQHRTADLRIERGQRFVQQQHARADRQRARDRHPLLLATARVAAGSAAQSRSCPPDAGSRARAARSPSAQRDARAGRRQRSPRRACAETARSSAPPCRCRAHAAARSVTSCSPMRMRPATGRTNPATARSAVVLPQPDGPMIAMISPGSMSQCQRRQRHRSLVCDRHGVEADTAGLGCGGRRDPCRGAQFRRDRAGRHQVSFQSPCASAPRPPGGSSTPAASPASRSRHPASATGWSCSWHRSDARRRAPECPAPLH